MLFEYPQVIPLAVVTAVGIFLLKEIVEVARRSLANRRKLRAIRELLIDECERNNFAFNSLLDQADQIGQALASGWKIEILSPYTGRDRLTTITEHGPAGTAPVRQVHRDIIDKYLFEVASLDGKLFWLMQSAGQALSEIKHVRDGFVYYPTDDPQNLDGFWQYAKKELDLRVEAIRSLYFYIANEPLTKTRLR